MGWLVTVKIATPCHKSHQKSSETLDDQYYCEICTYLLPSHDTVTKHVAGASHKANKGKQEHSKSNQEPDGSLKINVNEEFDGEMFVIGNTIVLMKQEWHGVVNKHCSLCDVAAKDFKTHVSCKNHLINLIQAKILLQDGKYYRKINEDMLYCFKCKKTFPAVYVKDHWGKEQHLEPESGSGPNLKYFDIDKNNNVVTCRHCKQILPFNLATLLKHRENHPNIKTLTTDIEDTANLRALKDHGKNRALLKEYGNNYCIKLTCGGRKGLCLLCQVSLVPNMNIFQEHVKGARHQGFMEHKGLIKKTKKAEKPHYKTKPWSQFVRSVRRVDESMICVINNELFVPVFGVMAISRIDWDNATSWKCFICDVTIPSPEGFKDHFVEHKQKDISIPTITTIKGELIREIRPNEYHCCFCNSLYPGWSVLEKHLKSHNHMRAKMQTMEELEETFKITFGGNQPQYLDLMNSIDILD